MAIVFQFDKRHNVTYAYNSISYYDKEKKQSRSKRTLLGRVDANGNIVPTKKTSRSKSAEVTSEIPTQNESIDRYIDEVRILKAQLEDLQRKLASSEDHVNREKDRTQQLVDRLMGVLNDFNSDARE